MKIRMITVSALLLTAILADAQRPMKAPAGGKRISNELIGIFFEDISYAADGGLNAQLVQNASFEYSLSEQDGWGPGTMWSVAHPGHAIGQLEIRQQNPLHPDNPTYMHIQVERLRHYSDYDGRLGYGLQNAGWEGMNVKEGEEYDFSAFLRNSDASPKSIEVVLLDPSKPTQPLALSKLECRSSSWERLECSLVPESSCSNALLQVLVQSEGGIDIDNVSLIPRDTYHGHGLRRDLAEALEALNPKFMRFPGGCVVHGGPDGFAATYRWKSTVGPKEQRKCIKNPWGYHQSMELGYFEYFQLCEDMGMEPVPILPCGLSCQGAGGAWGLPEQAQEAVPMSEMEGWVEDALDLIEWANGAADSEWGSVRAAAGHPEPFNLKYLGIGNEEKITPEFEERFRYMYERISAAHPEIVIIGTAGPGSHQGNPDYDNAWSFANELGLPVIDEHYYEPREYFQNSRQYDSYPRNRKTKVYLGEYASKDKKLVDALSEALYLLHVERNADIVIMTSYAPLFCRKGTHNWDPNLIYFDNERVIPSCSYYVQQLFGNSSGDYYYGDCVEIKDKTRLQEQSVVLNTSTRELFVKICNASSEAKECTVDLRRFKGLASTAELTVLSGDPMAENNFEQQPIAPKKEKLSIQKKMSLTAGANSLIMIRVALK